MSYSLSLGQKSMLTHPNKLLCYFGRILNSLENRRRERKTLLLSLTLQQPLRVMNIDESANLSWKIVECGKVSRLTLWLCRTMMAVCGLPIFPVWIQVEAPQANKTHPLDQR